MTTPRKLTAKQILFVEDFLSNGGDAQAAYRASFSAGRMSPNAVKTEAHRIVHYPHVAAEIEARREKVRQKTDVTRERLIQELARVAFSDIRNVIEFSSEGGVKLKDGKSLDPEVAATIAEVSEHQDGGKRVKLHDKLAAIDKLCRMEGFYKPARMEHSGPDGGPVRVEGSGVSGLLAAARSHAAARNGTT